MALSVSVSTPLNALRTIVQHSVEFRLLVGFCILYVEFFYSVFCMHTIVNDSIVCVYLSGLYHCLIVLGVVCNLHVIALL